MSERARLRGIGAAWYRRKDWPKWREIDPSMHPDFEAMRTRLEARIGQLQASGIPVIRVTIDPDEFLEWAGKNGGKVGTLARAQYAAEKTMQADG